jgi:hypothetical protein
VTVPSGDVDHGCRQLWHCQKSVSGVASTNLASLEPQRGQRSGVMSDCGQSV